VVEEGVGTQGGGAAVSVTKIYGMSAEEYHAKPHLSKSGMVEILKSPAHYQAYTQQQWEQTHSMLFGSALHTMVLEPHLFRTRYACQPNGLKLSTKEGKEWKESVGDQEIISWEDGLDIVGAAKSIKNAVSEQGLLDGSYEVSYFETAPVMLKCRPDIVLGSRLVDIKTTTDVRERAFNRTVLNFGYHIQAAHYMAMTGATEFVFIAVETFPPYAVQVYWLDDNWLAEGMRLRNRAIQIFEDCCKVDAWSSYSTEPKKLSMPAWAVDSTSED
jgi:exodeoxyribonuclease VIII